MPEEKAKCQRCGTIFEIAPMYDLRHRKVQFYEDDLPWLCPPCSSKNRVKFRSLRAVIAAALCVAVLYGPAHSQTVRMSRLQSRGAVLKGYRTFLGLTQDSLSKLTSPHVTKTEISRFERGIDSAVQWQEDAIANVIDSIVVSRLHPETEGWLITVLRRARR